MSPSGPGEIENNYFGLFPEGYLKLVPTDTFSVEGGKLPSLIGDEYTFTFENMNIERGLLWNLEPAISHGVQANLTTGPVAWAASFNDGFYSSDYSTLSGSATWTINPANTLAVAGGGNFSTSNVNSIAAPFQLDNSDVINLIYTYTNAPWTISPYFQYTSNKHSPVYEPGTTKDADTWGGAVLANYNIDDNWNLAGRVEYVSSSGSKTDGTVNVLFGPGSSAWSFTVTPTYQMGIWFARLEGSYVTASSVNSGDGFGKFGTSSDRRRGSWSKPVSPSSQVAAAPKRRLARFMRRARQRRRMPRSAFCQSARQRDRCRAYRFAGRHEKDRGYHQAVQAR